MCVWSPASRESREIVENAKVRRRLAFKQPGASPYHDKKVIDDGYSDVGFDDISTGNGDDVSADFVAGPEPFMAVDTH